MADFSTPFGSNADKRFPTTTEKANGFPCGPASQALHNGLQFRVESEIGHVIDHAGIVQTDDRMTQLREAIEALISAATGGNPAGYILMDQARARLPIFPEVLNTDGRIVVTSPAAGAVRLPGGVDFLHRGIFTLTTAQADFATAASKIYHLRWDKTNGFRLRDLADAAGYNPSAFAETNAAFDSTHDDMLIARVVTNASNVATITNLANKDRLYADGNSGVIGPTEFDDSANDPNALVATLGNSLRRTAVNWARRPRAHLAAFTDVTVQHSTTQTSEMNIVVRAPNRYSVEVIYQRTTNADGGLIRWTASA
jgi:hypothetical protein